jgi:hypothetical protein
MGTSDVEKRNWGALPAPRLAVRNTLQLGKDFILSLDADKDGKNSLTHDFFTQMYGKTDNLQPWTNSKPSTPLSRLPPKAA